MLFRPAYQLVQELLAAKRDLVLPQKLRRLDSIELLILDDIGYVKQSPEEAEVLFTLIAERYERRSMLNTSNLVFSDWERIFKDPMATAAAPQFAEAAKDFRLPRPAWLAWGIDFASSSTRWEMLPQV